MRIACLYSRVGCHRLDCVFLQQHFCDTARNPSQSKRRSLMALRRRPRPVSEEVVEPLDDDEQEEIVQSLEDEVLKQAAQMRRIFTAVCIVFACASLGMVWIGANSKAEWIHGIVSAGLHLLASRNIDIMETKRFRDNGTLVVAVVPLMILGYYRTTTSDLHWAMAISNLLSLLGSLFLSWDTISSLEGIGELRASKYKHKSL